ncbi:acetyltransferase [Salinicola salarius]|uniref:acetyltransferase n=1 Tax=Salinicola salarius TaxID=430457 RepID=UPI0023E46342|nr:acetyltransferase [Salinicola salarius]MDF3917322.1 acetyltransferase [Salinicola salarius]
MSLLPIILLGAGGHAKVVLDLIHALNRQILGICDPGLATQGAKVWRGLSVLGNDEVIERYAPSHVELANGTGSLPGSHLRRRLHVQFTRRGYRFATLVHPSAILGSGVELGRGVQIMAGAIVQADTRIGDNAILNTGARIDHDGDIGRHVHVAPGAVISGDVKIGKACHIGAGATLRQGICIGSDAIIGMGTTVIVDVASGHQQTGQPPRAPRRIN